MMHSFMYYLFNGFCNLCNFDCYNKNNYSNLLYFLYYLYCSNFVLLYKIEMLTIIIKYLLEHAFINYTTNYNYSNLADNNN